MALVGPYAVAGECANRAERCPGYASLDQRSLSTNVLLLVRPALPKKEGADVRYGSLADIEVSMNYVALRPKADILQHGFHVR